MLSLILALLLDPLDQVPTVGDNEEVSVRKVDTSPLFEFVGPDACVDERSQPSLTGPTIGEVADGWPNEMDVEGLVIGLIPGYCGFACSPGSFRIRVTKGPADVRDRDLYVATSCVLLDQVPEYCGKTVRLKARKLVRGSGVCGADTGLERSFFATNGMPYYVVDDAGEITVVALNTVTPQPQRLTDRSSGRTRVSRPVQSTGRATRRAAER